MYPYLFKSTTIRSAYISQGLIHSDADMKPIHGHRPGLENHPSKLSWEELKKKKKEENQNIQLCSETHSSIPITKHRHTES